MLSATDSEAVKPPASLWDAAIIHIPVNFLHCQIVCLQPANERAFDFRPGRVFNFKTQRGSVFPCCLRVTDNFMYGAEIFPFSCVHLSDNMILELQT